MYFIFTIVFILFKDKSFYEKLFCMYFLYRIMFFTIPIIEFC